ncbi:hypothetical protein M758_3G206200 [Ceratodon purpureus]|uniref:Uncharacterized protein n=1 Tax=Ceratodon purpureus TaxID=3225 RepID=A0A8T0IMA8_CERPU|nr:hypothetical protein KC19_3G206600 [Ceratodon purpureus]KAG0623841.1 hypothetical protein M758_3G206200 [Ceratodon purpureus]
MTTSRRLVDHKSNKFQKNILKRGQVPESTVKKSSSYPVGPVVLGLFIFVVVGSAILQIFRNVTSGGHIQSMQMQADLKKQREAGQMEEQGVSLEPNVPKPVLTCIINGSEFPASSQYPGVVKIDIRQSKRSSAVGEARGEWGGREGQGGRADGLPGSLRAPPEVLGLGGSFGGEVREGVETGDLRDLGLEGLET